MAEQSHTKHVFFASEVRAIGYSKSEDPRTCWYSKLELAEFQLSAIRTIERAREKGVRWNATGNSELMGLTDYLIGPDHQDEDRTSTSKDAARAHRRIFLRSLASRKEDNEDDDTVSNADICAMFSDLSSQLARNRALENLRQAYCDRDRTVSSKRKREEGSMQTLLTKKVQRDCPTLSVHGQEPSSPAPPFYSQKAYHLT